MACGSGNFPSAGGGPGGGVITSSGPPTGSCSASQLAVDTTTGNLYTCVNGNWFLAACGCVQAALSALSVSPGSILGGTANAIGTVTLTMPAGASGVVVTLSSSNAAAASVPASVTVPSGSSSATFTVTSHVVGSATTATITASYNSVNKTSNVTVTIPQPIYGGVGNPGATTATLSGNTVIINDGANSVLAQVKNTPEVVGDTWTFSPNNQCVYLVLFGGTRTFEDAQSLLGYSMNPAIAVTVGGVAMNMYQSTNQLIGTSRPKIVT